MQISIRIVHVSDDDCVCLFGVRRPVAALVAPTRSAVQAPESGVKPPHSKTDPAFVYPLVAASSRGVKCPGWIVRKIPERMDFRKRDRPRFASALTGIVVNRATRWGVPPIASNGHGRSKIFAPRIDLAPAA